MPSRIVAVVLALVACGTSGDRGPRTRGEAAGRELAAEMVAAMTRATTLVEPYRCARAEAAMPAVGSAAAGPAIELGRLAWRREGARLVGAARGAAIATLRIGVVADARGAAPATVTAAAALRDAFTAAGVDLVISLGGMGDGETALTATLGALAEEAPWPLLALPGDRERLPAHRAAVAALATRGGLVLDGAAVRRVEIAGGGPDGVVIATLPGVRYPDRLIGGAEGCVYDRADIETALAGLASWPGVRVLATYPAPRQRDEAASDLVAGIHAGDRELADAIAAMPAAPALVVHGELSDAATGDGSAPRGAMVVLGAGAAERVRATDTARGVLISIERSGLRWQRLTITTR